MMLKYFQYRRDLLTHRPGHQAAGRRDLGLRILSHDLENNDY